MRIIPVASVTLAAVFAMAPALVQALDVRSVEHLNLPVWIVAGDADTVAPPATNAAVVARLAPESVFDLLPQVGHYAFLSTCTPAGVASIRVCALAGLQAAAHQLAIAKARELFDRYVKP